MKTTKELLGERIRELRKSRGLTQEQLAELIDVEQKHVSRLELGKSFPTIERLERLAHALDIPLRDFFDFNHLADSNTLTQNIEEILAGLNEENTKIFYKMLISVAKSLQDK